MPRLAPRLAMNCAVVTPEQAHKVSLVLVAVYPLGCFANYCELRVMYTCKIRLCYSTDWYVVICNVTLGL